MSEASQNATPNFTKIAGHLARITVELRSIIEELGAGQDAGTGEGAAPYDPDRPIEVGGKSMQHDDPPPPGGGG